MGNTGGGGWERARPRPALARPHSAVEAKIPMEATATLVLDPPRAVGESRAGLEPTVSPR